MDTNWTYYALVLTEESRNKLMSYLQNSDYSYLFEEVSKVYLHHCTLLHKSQVNDNKIIKEHLYRFINNKFILTINGIGFSNKTIAFKSPTPFSANKTPHITIGTYGDGKPVDSNYIINWKEINNICVETVLKRI